MKKRDYRNTCRYYVDKCTHKKPNIAISKYGVTTLDCSKCLYYKFKKNHKTTKNLKKH